MCFFFQIGACNPLHRGEQNTVKTDFCAHACTNTHTYLHTYTQHMHTHTLLHTYTLLHTTHIHTHTPHTVNRILELVRFQVFGNSASERRGLPESLCHSACLPALFATLSACLSLSLHVSVSLHLFLSLAVSASSILFCLNHILALLVYPVQTEMNEWMKIYI